METQDWTHSLGRAKAEALMKALIASGGNITRAALAMDLSRPHVTKMLRDFKLKDFARQLRVQTTGGGFGRPRGATTKNRKPKP